MRLEFENQGGVMEPEGYINQNTLTLQKVEIIFSLSSVMPDFNEGAIDNSQEPDKLNS